MIGYKATNQVEAGDTIGQRTTFHSIGSQLTCIRIFTFVVPIVLGLVSLTASEIDGEPLSGLCLVGIRTLWAYCVLVVAPLASCLMVKVIYVGRAVRCLRRLRDHLVATSYAPSDREMAHRLTMCFRAYGTPSLLKLS